MAIVTSGPMVGFVGTIDNITYYTLPDGRTCAKAKNGPRTIPPTRQQLANEADTKLVAKFMKSFKEFISVGYQLEAKKVHQNPYNMMVKYIRKNAIEGTYPNRRINITKVLVANGDLPAASETSVAVTEKGLTFKWSTELVRKASHHTDQVMMLAYFPEIQHTEHVLGGAHRFTGTDVLNLTGVKKGVVAEVFISFIADDHSSISNSIYLGQFNW